MLVPAAGMRRYTGMEGALSLSVREIYIARLERKTLLSAAAECYHFEFTFVGPAPPQVEPGQFFSLLADDPSGKTYTRAYSIASAAPEPGPVQTFDLCVNRVAGGFYSNLLCDLPEGDTIQCHGPHGLFTLRQPPADGLLLAAGTGIAPMRSFVQWLFPDAGPDRTAGREYWLVYEASHPEDLFYDSCFQQLAARHANFHYIPVVGGNGRHEPLEREIVRITQAIPGGVAPSSPVAGTQSSGPAADQAFPCFAYVCGLGEFVKAARGPLMAHGWQKRQVLFERYD
jgi:ferredoxin-NADP reductase